MKSAPAKTPSMTVAVVESDPLRLVGFRSLFDSQGEIDLAALSLDEIRTRHDVDVALLGSRNGQNLFDLIASLKAARPDLRILVTGSNADDETILKSLAAGAKGYVDEGATPAEFVQALKVVHQGWVWAPRRVLALFVDRVAASGRIFPAGRLTFTDREKEVLELSRRNARHRRAHGKGPRSQTDAQGRGAEPHRTVCTCHHAFPGFQ